MKDDDEGRLNCIIVMLDEMGGPGHILLECVDMDGKILPTVAPRTFRHVYHAIGVLVTATDILTRSTANKYRVDGWYAAEKPTGDAAGAAAEAEGEGA